MRFYKSFKILMPISLILGVFWVFHLRSELKKYRSLRKNRLEINQRRRGWKKAL